MIFVVPIALPIYLLGWIVLTLFRLAIWAFALLAVILIACGYAGWRIGERIEDRRRDRRFSASRPT